MPANGTTALAAPAEQHPIIAQIDARMPQIAEMLPAGMDPVRFRRVVVQALVKNPDLWQCTPISVVTAIVEAAEAGLEPTGSLGRAYLIPYTVKGEKRAQLQIGFRGYAELAWRADRTLLSAEAVRKGDDFDYAAGTQPFLRFRPNIDDPEREKGDANITHFFALATFPDGRVRFEVMSRAAADRIRDRARYRNPVWESDYGEMGKKTAVRRLVKLLPLSPQMRAVLAREEEYDFAPDEAPAARPVVATRQAAVAQRLAALPAPDPEPPAEGEAPAQPIWMRRLHAVGAELGFDHAAIHDLAVATMGVASLSELDEASAVQLEELLRNQQPASGAAVPPPAADPSPADTSAELALHAAAKEHGIFPADAEPEAAWAAIDAVARAAFPDRDPDSLNAHDYAVLAAAITAGMYDAPKAARPRRARVVTP